MNSGYMMSRSYFSPSIATWRFSRVDLHLGGLECEHRHAAHFPDHRRVVSSMDFFRFGRRTEQAGHLAVSLFIGFLRECQIAGVGVALAVESRLQVVKGIRGFAYRRLRRQRQLPVRSGTELA